MNKGKKGKGWWWHINQGEGIRVEIYKERHHGGGYTYFALNQVLWQLNFVNFGSIFINDHKWVKFVNVNKNNYLQTGYLTRKGQNLILTFRYLHLNEESMQEVREFGKNWEMSDEQKLMLKEAFKHTDELFTIEY